MINDLGDGKFSVEWMVALVRSKDGRYFTGRYETAFALAGPGAKAIRTFEVTYVGSLEECERQL